MEGPVKLELADLTPGGGIEDMQPGPDGGASCLVIDPLANDQARAIGREGD